MQMCVVEMASRPGKPLFHLEHYIEGQYIKYNSNSGFVRDDNIRLTPQVYLAEPVQNVAATESDFIHTDHEPVFTQQSCGLRLSVTLRLNARDTS